MEVRAGLPHIAFPVDHASRVGEARRYAARMSEQLAWNEVDCGRLSIVVTELATNLLRHAQRGRLLIALRPEKSEVEILAIDRGPGIGDPERCLGDGYSTGGTAGTGLGAVRRLSQDFDLASSKPEGTVVLARLRQHGVPVGEAQAFDIGAICLPAPGEEVSGDVWMVCTEGDRAAVMVADGLGHGPDAFKAAQCAIDVFRRSPLTDLRLVLQDAHRELRTTRGAAVSSFQLDAGQGTVRAAGVGNVMCRIVSGVSDRALLPQQGTLGVQIRSLEEVVQAWPAHAAVVVHTDGIEARWMPGLLLPLLGRDPVLIAAILMRDHCRGHDDATAVVVRRRAA